MKRDVFLVQLIMRGLGWRRTDSWALSGTCAALAGKKIVVAQTTDEG